MSLSQHEVIDPWVPANVSFGHSLFSNDVTSVLDKRMAPVIYLLSGSEDPLDFGGLGELSVNDKYDVEKVLIGHDELGFEMFSTKKKVKPQHRHRRRMKLKDEHGHRHNLITLKEIIRPVSVISPSIFGITAKGASENKVRHREELCR